MRVTWTQREAWNITTFARLLSLSWRFLISHAVCHYRHFTEEEIWTPEGPRVQKNSFVLAILAGHALDIILTGEPPLQLQSLVCARQCDPVFRMWRCPLVIYSMHHRQLCRLIKQQYVTRWSKAHHESITVMMIDFSADELCAQRRKPLTYKGGHVFSNQWTWGLVNLVLSNWKHLGC